MGKELVTRSFELASERCEDLTPLVYARLFRECPELEAMFVLDQTGAARGNMLSWVINALLDSLGESAYGENMIRTEALNHSGIGVTPEQFSRFFGIVADTLKDLLGADWSDDMAAAWRQVLLSLDRIIAPAP